MRIVILGNGITGVSAALRIRRERPDWPICIVSGESTHHYSRPALMYIYMGHLSYRDTKPYEDHFWREQRLELRRAWVRAIDFERRELQLQEGDALPYDRLLLATGSKPRLLGWPGQELQGVQGLYGLDDLRRLIENSRQARRAVIVGGGLIGIELAEMLHSRGIHVSMLVREEHYWGNVLPREEALLIHRRLSERGIDLRTRSQLAEIVDDGNGRVCAVMTDQRDRLDCQLVGLTVGVAPNLDLLREGRPRSERGVLVDRSFRSSEPEVFAAGDCAQFEDGLLQQVWYTARAQGDLAGAAMAGLPVRYEPGIWFNSAKFFDLEYQTYGRVPAEIAPERSFWWQDAAGDRGLRIVHEDGRVIGFNFLGLRARQGECEAWIARGASLQQVLEELPKAHFDAEFARRFHAEIRDAARVARA